MRRAARGARMRMRRADAARGARRALLRLLHNATAALD
jgi:hypothetical protein